MNPSLRCSSLDRDLECNGAITLVSLVDPRSGDEGEEGQFLHWVSHSKMKLEMGAVGDIGPQPTMPKSISFSGWISEFYLRFAREVFPAGWALEVEAALAYDFTGFTLTGHIDSFAISPDATEAIGLDLKTGYLVVDPAECNEQIFGYSCLLLMAYPSLKKITFYIIQPRLDEDEGQKRISDPLIVEGEELASFIPALERRVNAAIANRFELSTGKKQCRWCPVSVQCPALQKEQQLMKHTLTAAELSRIKAIPDDALLGDWVIVARTLRQPTEDAESLLKERLEKQGYVDSGSGTRITMKIQGGSYEFPDKAAFYAALERLIPDPVKRAQALKFSVTETRAAIADAQGIPKTGKAAVTAEKVFDAELRPLTIQGTRQVLQFQ